jgi:hypothetical protein
MESEMMDRGVERVECRPVFSLIRSTVSSRSGRLELMDFPVADKKGQEFPPKVMERFRRDLERHKASKCDEINK